jgi:hypothetical protein
MEFRVLKDYHTMIGVPWLEKHDAVFPPGVPSKLIPHVCTAPLCIPPWGGLTGLPNGNVLSSANGRTLGRGSDIGPLIPHINIPPAPPNLLLPIILLASGSKSHFGANRDVTPQGPVAFACLKYIHFNLNCAGPTAPPLPSGFVFPWNTHVTGVTWGDIVSGLAHMVADSLIQYGMNKLFASKLFEKFSTYVSSKIASAILPHLAQGGLLRMLGVKTMSDLLQALGHPVWGYGVVDQALGLILADVIGSPLGYSRTGPYSPGNIPGDVLDPKSEQYPEGRDAVQQAVDSYLNNPSVEQHPSQPPAQPSAPPPQTPSQQPPAPSQGPPQPSQPGDFPPAPNDNVPV